MIVHACSADVVELEPQSIATIVTSPPYWGKRTYGDDTNEIGGGGQTLIEYARSLTLMAGHWRPALRDDGSLWMNLGDTWAGSGGSGGDHAKGSKQHMAGYKQGRAETVLPAAGSMFGDGPEGWHMYPGRLGGGQLTMTPWVVAWHLQGAGWTVRSMIVWNKQRVRPDDVRRLKRPLDGAYEMILMVTKSPNKYRWYPDVLQPGEMGDVWTFPPGSSTGDGGKGGHVAPFPDEIPRRCIALTTDPGDLVFDPFLGSGTTGRVAEAMGRRAVGCEIYAGQPGFVGLS